MPAWPKRFAGVIGHAELIDSRVAAVQKPDAVLPALHFMKWLDGAIHQKRVTENSVLVQLIEDQLTVVVEDLVLEHDGHTPDLERLTGHLEKGKARSLHGFLGHQRSAQEGVGLEAGLAAEHQWLTGIL